MNISTHSHAPKIEHLARVPLPPLPPRDKYSSLFFFVVQLFDLIPGNMPTARKNTIAKTNIRNVSAEMRRQSQADPTIKGFYLTAYTDRNGRHFSVPVPVRDGQRVAIPSVFHAEGANARTIYVDVAGRTNFPDIPENQQISLRDFELAGK
jgi:hypothetical protein